MKSDTKNQMSTKQIPFVFFIFFSVRKIPVLCTGTFSPSICMFIPGQAPAPVFSMSLPFLGDHVPGQRSAKGRF